MTDTSISSPPHALQVGDFVRVVSLDERDWKFSWDSRPYNLPAGGTVLMPFECASLWFGDPRSSGNVASIRNEQGLVSWIGDRATEVRRLRTKYDNQFGDENVIEKAPLVEVSDLEGNRVYTVLDDPDGQGVMPAQTSIMDQTALMATVQRQERLIQMLLAQSGMDENANMQHVANSPAPVPDENGLDENGNLIDPLSLEPAEPGPSGEEPAIPEDNGNA